MVLFRKMNGHEIQGIVTSVWQRIVMFLGFLLKLKVNSAYLQKYGVFNLSACAIMSAKWSNVMFLYTLLKATLNLRN